MTPATKQDRAKILAETVSWLGTPYHHQSRVKGHGADCLGLILGVWENVYGEIPEKPWAYDPAWVHRDPEDKLLKLASKYSIKIRTSDATSGDFVIIRMRSEFAAKHMGILFDEKTLIHSHYPEGVIKSPISDFRLIPGWYRFPSIRSYRNSLENR